jgi:hypothetical protein
MAEEASLRIKRVLTNPDVPPKTVNKFMWARVGTDVCLEAGFFDLFELREAVEAARTAGQSSEVTLRVTDRFVLSPQAVADLIQVVREMETDAAANLPAGAGIVRQK